MRIVILLTLLALIVSCAPSATPTLAPTPTPRPQAYTVTYRVTCPTWPDGKAPNILTGGADWIHADLTYRNATGDTEQRQEVRLPWTMEFKAQDGAFLYVSAQMQGTALSPSLRLDIQTEILVNGVVVKQATSKGSFCIATASGAL